MSPHGSGPYGLGQYGPSQFGPDQFGPSQYQNSGGPGQPPFSMNSRQFLRTSSAMGEPFFVGAFAVLAGFAGWTLMANHRTMPAIQKVLFGSSIFMFLNSLIHMAVVVQQATVRRFLPDLNTTAGALALCQFVISDVILIWRVWTVWDKKLLAILAPVITFLAAAGTMIYTISSFGSRFVGTAISVPLTVANTVICAALILFRMRRPNSSTTYTPKGISGLLAMVVGSGALLAVYAIIGLIVFFSPPPGYSVVQNIQVPLIGILSTLILLFAYYTSDRTRPDGNIQRGAPSKEIDDDDSDYKWKQDHHGKV